MLKLAAAAGMLLFSATAPAQDRTFSGTVQPFLARNCTRCHGGAIASAGLNLETLHDPAKAGRQWETWDKVLDKLRTGKMPPPGQPVPPPAEVQAVTRWIETLAPSQSATAPAPGRVTARRLNRIEYDNTIRDLLGVHMRPAADFPVDDSGYGFDNIGDVLSLSPLLMEKYLAAARRVAHTAVEGELYPPKPGLLARLNPKKSHEPGPALQEGTYLPYSMRGALFTSFLFPVDAEYEFRIRVQNFRGRDERDYRPEDRAVLAERRRKLQERIRSKEPRPAPTPEELRALEEFGRKAFPPVDVVISLDGKPVLRDVVEGDSTYLYDRGEIVARVPVTAGYHDLRASYPALANIDDPRHNVNPDARRKLYIDYMDVAGPYNPSTAPPASYRRIFVCGHNRGGHQPSCARPVLERLTERAFRRPVAPAELERFTGLVALALREGDSFENGVRVALEAILVSPHFLFRVEPDPPAGLPARALNGFELASRLSYFLWASMPDDALFRAARQGTLLQPAGLEAQTRRLLAHPNSSALVDSFAAQWLNLANLRRNKPDYERFATVDDELLEAMHRETALFTEAIIREDRSILDFIDAPFTFLNGPLARHYGIPGVEGEAFRRVNLEDGRRSGILTQAAVLTVSSFPTRTSPVVRGKWVLETLLGAPPPPPPPDVPSLNETGLGSAASLRTRLEEHRRNPACAACHDQMDAIGFGLEGYDAVGSWRTHDGTFPVDTSGVLPDGTKFSGALELKRILRRQAPAFTRNFTEKLMTYALGRGLERSDSDIVESISSRVAAEGYRFSVLVREIVNSRPFQMRGAR